EEASTSQCVFECLENYSWNGSACVADTQVVACTGLPQNAAWNTASEITQTWSGSEWLPSAAGAFEATPSSTECRFRCDATYIWSSGACVPDRAATRRTCQAHYDAGFREDGSYSIDP